MTCTNCADLLHALEVARERVFYETVWDNSAGGRRALRIIDAAIAKAKGGER